MYDFQLTTPVAFFIFNRPDKAERVFSEIAKAKPSKLLVVADGPRHWIDGESEKCATTRAIIDLVNWDCEVLTNYSEVNLGCKVRVSSGIDWVFEQVEEAIILEDDCLPDVTFFRFCQEMLEYYRHDQSIGMISGDNFQFGQTHNNDSYYFSKYMHIWGWATWRVKWQESYDVSLGKWPLVRDESWLQNICSNKQEAKMWEWIFEQTFCGKIDTWDYSWLFANWIEGRVSIVPNVNLISNIGFGGDATHTVAVTVHTNIPSIPIIFPLKHPGLIKVNQIADSFEYKNLFHESIYNKLCRKIKRIIKLFSQSHE